MRKLDFLVPMYNEDESVLFPLLDSIAIQQSVKLEDVGVIICCDGGTARVSDATIAKYPFNIEFHMCEHKGVSATRNACLELSSAEYVIFADCDDMMCHVCGLHIVFREMDGEGFDTLTSMFVEETRHPETKEPLYINHEMDSTFVHGKVHRRAYLVENGIRFDDSLTVHEDSYFNILAQNIADKERAKYCPTAFYLWKWRDASVCRHDPDYILKTYNNMLDSNDALIREFERRGMHDKARSYCCFMIMDAYYTMNKKEWIDKTHADYRDAVERRFSRYFADHRELWDEVPANEKMMVSNAVRSRSVMEGMPMETMTIDSWLAHVAEI